MSGPAETTAPTSHWDAVYGEKTDTDLSWYQPDAGVSMRLVEAALARTGARPGAAVDVGCGTSTLLEELLDAGWRHVTGVDVSAEALAAARRRLDGRPATDALADLFADGFDLVAGETETHRTPWGSTQEFTWATLLRR